MKLALAKIPHARVVVLGAGALLAAVTLLVWAQTVILKIRVHRAIASAAEPAKKPEPTPAAPEATPEPGKRTRGKRDLASMLASPTPTPRAVNTPIAAPMAQLPDKLAELMKSKPLFGKPSRDVKIQGILGDKVLVNGKWMAAGEENEGVRLVEFDTENAVLEVYGETQELPVWSPLEGGDAKGKGKDKRERREARLGSRDIRDYRADDRAQRDPMDRRGGRDGYRPEPTPKPVETAKPYKTPKMDFGQGNGGSGDRRGVNAPRGDSGGTGGPPREPRRMRTN